MTKDTSTVKPKQSDGNPLPKEASGSLDRAPSRTIEIMVYALGLILAMFIAWHHDPNVFF